MGWRIYADFLLGAGHRRVAVAAEPSVYWASGTRILQDHLSPGGGSITGLDLRGRPPVTVCDELAASDVTAVLLLAGYPEPVVPLVQAIRADQRLAGSAPK